MAVVVTVNTLSPQSIDFVVYDASAVVDDLAITAPVVELMDLTWTHSPTPGTYELWYTEGLVWVDSGLSTTADNMVADLPRSAFEIELRNNGQPSNRLIVPYVTEAPDVTITAQNRYDGVKIAWTPFVATNIEIKRGATIIFQGPASTLSYFVDTNATGVSANYTAQAYIGTKPSDFIDSLISNTVAGFKLTIIPYEEPTPIPADCFIGLRPGTGIVDTGTDELGDPVPFLDAVGCFIITEDSGDEADLIGTSHDLDDTTYFHSENDYVFVDSVIELTSFSVGTNGRHVFTLTGAAITALDAGTVYLIRLSDDIGTVSFANPVFYRHYENSAGYVTQITSLSDWTFQGGGNQAGHYLTGHTQIEAEANVDSLKIYMLNITMVSDALTYSSRVQTNLQMTPQVGGPGEVYMDGTYFRVNGVDFGTLDFLCNLGDSVNEDFVVGLRNTFDDVIPLGDGNTVDPSLIHYGAGTCLQVLGSYPGAAGWYMDFENGRIWREAAGNEIDWWNAAKGRTRLRYEGVTSLDGTSQPYTNTAVDVGIPTESTGDPTYLVSSGSMTAITSVQSDITIDVPKVYGSSIFGVVVTPRGWTDVPEIGDYEYFEDQQSIIFSSFNIDTDFVPIYKYYNNTTTTPVIINGDPFYPTKFILNGTVYMARTSETTFRLYYTYEILAYDGSVAVDSTPLPGITLRVPQFSFSFLQMR